MSDFWPVLLTMLWVSAVVALALVTGLLVVLRWWDSRPERPARPAPRPPWTEDQLPWSGH